MNVVEATVDVLAAAGVDTVFTLASEEIIPLLSEMEDNRADEFRVIHCRHEQGAAAMADGYSRAGNGIGVCIVGRGPAIAQTGTALVSASNHGAKVCYLVPETRRTTAHDGKGFRQETYLETMAGQVESIRTAEGLPDRLAGVIRRLRAGEGPIAVQVPIDVLEADLDDDAIPSLDGAGPPAAHMEPAPAKVEAAVEAYLDADATAAPVILAGRGAVAAHAKDAIERIAERMNAYLVTSLGAIGYFADHPFSLGFAGDLGSELANEYLANSGYVLAIGCSLNHHTVDHGQLLREDAAVVHVDTAPGHIGRFTAVDVGVVGDARATAAAIEGELERVGIDRTGEFWTERVRTRIEEHTIGMDRSQAGHPNRVDPRALVGSLDRALPDDRFVVVDVGHAAGFVFDRLSIDPTDHLLWTTDFLALGQALPLGAGAALAGDDRTVIVFCGDGGLMMILQELETAARHDVPMIVVVLNDDALGAERHMGRIRGYSGAVGEVPAPDIGTVATHLGADGHTVRSTDDIAALEPVLTADLSGPLLVDCRIDPEVVHRSMGSLSIE